MSIVERFPDGEARATLAKCAGGDAGEPSVPSVGLLLCRDLIFQAKIRGTAEGLGYRMVVVGDAESLKAQIRSRRPCVVIVDLSAGEAASAGALGEYLGVAGPDIPFLGFGSHVDTAVLAAARAAGCHSVMPRSKFSAELPVILKRYFEGLSDSCLP